MTALKTKRIDLYECFFEKVPITRKEEQRIATLLLPVLMVVVMAGCYGFFSLENAMLRRRLAPVETYLNTLDSQTLHQRADTLQLQDDRLTTLADNMQGVAAAVDSYPHLEEAMLESVYFLATGSTTVAALTYDGVTGILGIVIDTDSPESGQDYLERLRATGYFDKLEHLGYSGDTAGVAIYTVEILATLPSPQSAATEESAASSLPAD